jgi:anti-sigma-K factor RskA
MSDHPQRELAPLAALGALDGDSLVEWKTHVADCSSCREELAVQEALVGSIGVASAAPQPPSADLRRRVLAAAGVAQPNGRTSLAPPSPRRAPLLAYAASLAALALGATSFVLWQQRDAAEREAEGQRQQLLALEARHRDARVRLAELQVQLAEQAVFARLLASQRSRMIALSGLPAAPGAQARMVWSAADRQAVLLATGLPPAPPGKAYELWVIAGGAPVPAGLFQVDPQGQAVFRAPWVDATTRVKTFAVTLEPAQGVPAPTGPMVLAGNVS